ncbi:hypothetical protein MHYP_G00175110 [Metynnis hypsauchen]
MSVIFQYALKIKSIVYFPLLKVTFNSTPPTVRFTPCKCHLQAMNVLKNLLQNRKQDGESEEDKTRTIRIIGLLETFNLPTEEDKSCLVERRKRKTNSTSGPTLKHYLQHLREFYKKPCTFKETA